ncbi:MAG TPA: metalloregulator ArsR/SmtB family transcription factor [Spirochaetia bacterium]|nr:metalloregulator ArsR/SmtB family transcription factor [Spirochaetia bacterium]
MARLAAEGELSARCAETLKALAHAHRLRIVAILCEGDETVIGLSRRLSLKQAIVSQQLRILRMSGLVDACRVAGFARYRITQPRLRQLVTCLEGCHAVDVKRRTGGGAR